ncbi:hypothetical protein SAMN04488527_1683 [Aliiroseovarius crassostreae]|uniref:hypothetical protein n=1 Tax=Aliiroseovarius crassostreae TaxID=154981 RepID=UPI0008E229A0|nr:hypothetical protein [Aliiroseovarius crassostreae]SFU98296.1 hypothetical protein SAMN04488527_1683 [Aliiroseovarius crassostreae]
MKLFVLLMLVPGGGGMSAEFTSLEKCEAAIEAFAAETGDHNKPIGICVEK